MKRCKSTIHIGSRAYCSKIDIEGLGTIRKKFERTKVGIECLGRELLARELFRGRPWMAPILRQGSDWLDFPMYPEHLRLDRVAPKLSLSVRRKLAGDALAILFDIFSSGYAHKDFHARNLFLVNDQLIVIDFEELERYEGGAKPPFPRSFDLIGQGLKDSGFGGNIMCYVADTPSRMSLQHVLGVPLDEVLPQFTSRLRMELVHASKTFATKRNGKSRHACRNQQIYCSFDVPFFRVAEDEAQRDSKARFAALGIREENLKGKRLLDMGCHTGGMLFAAQEYGPRYSMGIEYDREKVAIASKIASYAGLNNTDFIHADIDYWNGIHDRFDVVFCFAIEAHINNQNHLYRLLAELTSDVLYFEGNSTSKIEHIQKMLETNGFKTVRFIGVSDDDCRSNHTPRPMFVARK